MACNFGNIYQICTKFGTNQRYFILNIAQGNCRSSVAKFPDFSSYGMTISLTLLKQQPNHVNVRNGYIYTYIIR